LTTCRLDDDVIEFADSDGNTMTGKKGIVPELVILKGEMMNPLA
jgi:hypothetical protein